MLTVLQIRSQAGWCCCGTIVLTSSLACLRPDRWAVSESCKLVLPPSTAIVLMRGVSSCTIFRPDHKCPTTLINPCVTQELNVEEFQCMDSSIHSAHTAAKESMI